MKEDEEIYFGLLFCGEQFWHQIR